MVGALVLTSAPIRAAAPEQNFAFLSLEELTSIKVTSVSKKAESWFQTPAAVSVLTGEDLRRAGVQNLPDAFRLVPGMEVAQVDSHQWAVTTRGFNDTFAQKQLVMVDGRSIYSPLFSGVLWQGQDLMLEDLDRIEVIRGPGGSVWGANAVNGVINIVSKAARETQGLLLSSGSGSYHEAEGAARYGGKLGEHAFYRAYGKYDEWEESKSVFGGKARDEMKRGGGGFRLDWEASSADLLTVQADGLQLQGDHVFPIVSLPVNGVPPPLQGYITPTLGEWSQTHNNLLGRWNHTLSDRANFSAQAYWDRMRLKLPMMALTADVLDWDVQNHFWLGDRNDIVWGGGYRLYRSDLRGSSQIDLSDPTHVDQTFNAFLQDEVTLIPDRVRWTLGSKIEHNDYTGWEYQPSTRLLWNPTEHQTVWAAAGRAVRVPSQVESDARVLLGAFPANPPTQPFPTAIQLRGNPGFKAEDLIAYELGYRIQAAPQWTIDLAAFFNDYQDLRSTVQNPDLSTLPDYATINTLVLNDSQGQTYGGELAVTYQPWEWWQLVGQVTYIDSDLEAPPNLLNATPSEVSISSPRWQASLRSTTELPYGFEFNFLLRYVGQVKGAGIAVAGALQALNTVPAYLVLDVNVTWHATKNLELALAGQNLGDAHREFVPTYFSSQYTEVSPSVFGKVTWRF